MPTFEELMALSATQTKQAESKLQQTMNERKQKEQQKRKDQEEREKREREQAAKQRLQYFEKQKREKQEQERQARMKQAKEQALQRRTEEQRDALIYGVKKTKSSTSSGSGSSSPKWPTKKRQEEDEDDGVFVGSTLTREEKREQKLQRELNRTFNNARRSTRTGGYMKAGRRLPGGAVDIVTSSTPSPDSGLSVKERIAAAHNGLQRLNVVKRDRRTIDEYRSDMIAKKSQVIQGDQARNFNDWFSTKKKDEPIKSSPAVFHSPSPLRFSSPASVPTPAHTKPKASAPRPPPATAKSSTASTPSSKSLARSSDRASSSKLSVSHTNLAKKRPRSPTRSLSPPPKRRKEPQPDVQDDIRSTIWSMFGKDRTKYVGHDDFSDDSDMEADASALEREERQSSRVAKREDEEAARQLKRHEEEKRRRKMQKGIAV